jgi:hypothetical protein
VQQAELWHDTILDALGAAVQAAGGVKKVSGRLWPTLDSVSSAARLRGALNPDHAQVLKPDELLHIGRLAREFGDSSVMNFLAREWGYAVEPLAPEQAKKRAKVTRRKALLDELRRLEDDE